MTRVITNDDPLTLSLSPRRLCHNQRDEGSGSRVPKLWNAGLLGMWIDVGWKLNVFVRLAALSPNG